MATISKLPSGKCRAQIRRQGIYRAQTFARKLDAQAWAAELERSIEGGTSAGVRKQELLARLKGRGRSYRDLKEEIVALIECGDVEVKIGDDGSPERPEMVRLAP
jgi:hypothetical protein